MRPLASLSLVLVSLAACNQTQKNCEHARDVYVRNAERETKAALATVAAGDRARLERAAKADIEKAKAEFVTHCLALDEAGQACIARIDEIEKADVDKRAAVEACPKDQYGFPEAACEDRAKAAQATIVGPCDEQLGAVVAKIYGNPKPTSPDVIELEPAPR